MITISSPHTLYFAAHPIRFSFSTDDSSVTRFRIQVFQGTSQVGKNHDTKFFNQEIPMNFQHLIDDYLRKIEGIRMPSGETLKAYAPLSFTIKATELINDVAQPTTTTTTTFVVHRGRLPQNVFDENIDSINDFDHTTNSFLSNYPTPERIFAGQTKYITYLNTYSITQNLNYKLELRVTWIGGSYSEDIDLPAYLSLVQLAIDTDIFGIPSSIKKFTIQVFIKEEAIPDPDDDGNNTSINFIAQPISEVRTYEIIQDNCQDNRDFLFFNHYNQPQAFRCTDGWVVFNSVTRNNFRDTRNYRQARTKEAFRSYAARRPFLRASEITALSEMRTANHVFLWEDGEWRRVNLSQKKWKEEEQYKYLHTLELTFDKSAPYK